LFNYSQKHGCLPRDLGTEAEAVNRVPEDDKAENQIFEPDQMDKLLSKAPIHLVPSMAIKAFSGVRTEQIFYMEWEHNPEARQLVEYEAGHCPAGRLVAWDRETGKPIESKFEPSLGLIEDTDKKVSGPIWVRGGIPVVSAGGKTYEIRNRMTLCRCGRSDNKPFCNGAHPDGNGVELYWDRPKEQWPRTPDGGLAMVSEPLDLRVLLKEALEAKVDAST
jgi:hypothetical protein